MFICLGNACINTGTLLHRSNWLLALQNWSLNAGSVLFRMGITPVIHGSFLLFQIEASLEDVHHKYSLSGKYIWSNVTVHDFKFASVYIAFPSEECSECTHWSDT